MTQDPKITQIDRYIERTDAESKAYEDVEYEIREYIDELIYGARQKLEESDKYADRLIQRVRIKAFEEVKDYI
jgi:hypothetical protein